MVAVILCVFLLLVLIFGAGSYTAALGSDPFGIVHFAQHLARGEFYSDFPVYDWAKLEWGRGESHFILGGNYVKTGDRMYNKYTIGFPLLLALSIRLFGGYSVYFFNLIILLALLLAHFWLALLFLRDRPGGRWLALSAPLVLLVMVDPAWRLALRPSHDLAGIMFVVAGAALAIRALRDSPRIRVRALLAGAFVFGCAGTLRLPNVLAAVPAGMYFLVRVIGRVRWWKILVLAFLGVVLFALALSPALIQNQLTGGHPLRPPRPEIVDGERTVLGGLDQESPPPLWVGFFPTTFPQVARYFWRLWGPLFTFLAVLGLISLGRRPEIGWLLLGIPLILILLYSMWVHIMYRYMLVAHPFLIVLMVAGAGRLLLARPRWWSASGVALIVFLDYLMRHRVGPVYRVAHLDLYVLVVGLVLWLLFVGRGKFVAEWWPPAVWAAVLLGLFVARYGIPWLHRPDLFQLAEAKQLGSDIDSLVPRESVVFSTKPIFQYINLFSSSYSIRPFEMGRIGIGSREGFQRLLDRGTGLYVLDNSSYKRDCGKSIPLFREYYDVTPVGELRGEKYRLSAHFGKPACVLYRIEPWSEKEIRLDFEIPDDLSEILLAFNLRKIHDPDHPRRRLEVELDGFPLPGPFHDGINFFHLRGEELSARRLTLIIRSDRPLPRDVELRVADLLDPYPVDLAGAVRFPDRDAGDIFTEERLRDADLVRLDWERTGTLEVPTLLLPGTSLFGELEVLNAQNLEAPTGLRVILNGEEIARFALGPGAVREKFSFPFPERLISSSRSELDFTADRPPGRALSLAEEHWGALLFESITVRRWRESFPLPLGPGESGLAAFTLAPCPGETCPGPYRILVGGEERAVSRGEGVQRLPIGPVPAGPVPVLAARGADGSCRPVFSRGPLVWREADRLLIDIGGRDDWAVLEDGFYPPELHQGRTAVRWTGKASRLVLPVFPREGREATLTLKTIGSRPPATFRSSPRVAAWLDGMALGEHLLREEAAEYSWTLPAEPAGPRFAELTLRVDPWRPSDFLPVSDGRELGLMVDGIELEYRAAGE